MQEVAETQSEMTYIQILQATVAQWGVLRPIVGVCSGEKSYKGSGCRKEAWWRQEVTEKKLWATLTGVSREATRRRLQGERFMQWDPEGGGDTERKPGIVVLRTETPGWSNDLVR